MLRLSLRTLSSVTPSRSLPPYSISIARCSTSSPPHLTYPPHSHGDPDPRNVRVSVWWDIYRCYVPSGVNVSRGVQAITAAIESSGIKGPIQITAFGDMTRMSRTNQQALSSTAIKISHSHIPPGCIADRSLFEDLMFWVSDNPPPAHLFIITDDGGSSSLLHRLRMNNYNILLATPHYAPVILKNAATISWDWDDLVTGKNLTGRYFQQPPRYSCYGHYEGPLEDPLLLLPFAPDDSE